MADKPIEVSAIECFVVVGAWQLSDEGQAVIEKRVTPAQNNVEVSFKALLKNDLWTMMCGYLGFIPMLFSIRVAAVGHDIEPIGPMAALNPFELASNSYRQDGLTYLSHIRPILVSHVDDFGGLYFKQGRQMLTHAVIPFGA